MEGVEVRGGKRSMIAKMASSFITPSNVGGASKSLMFGDHVQLGTSRNPSAS